MSIYYEGLTISYFPIPVPHKRRKGKPLTERSWIGRVVRGRDGGLAMITGLQGSDVVVVGHVFDCDHLDQIGVRFEDGSRLFEEVKDDRHE